MSDPGHSVTRTIGGQFEERTIYPDDRCWTPAEGVDLSMDIPPISPETAEQALQRASHPSFEGFGFQEGQVPQEAPYPVIHFVRSDFHGDGFPDTGRVIETGSHFLVVLNEGYLYVNRIKGKLDARFSQVGLSKRSHLLGVIPKSRSIQKIERIVARPRHSDELGDISDIVVQGLVIYGGRQTTAEWIFRQVPCGREGGLNFGDFFP